MIVFSLYRWFLNMIKNNIWVIVLGIGMWFFSSINSLKFSEIAVQNAECNLKSTLGSYLFVSNQLESITSAQRSPYEQYFIEESTQLEHKQEWSFEDISSYLSSINNAEAHFSDISSDIDSMIKKVLFSQKHTDLVVSIHTYDETVKAHNELLTKFPERFFTKKLGMTPHPTLPIPSVLDKMPVLTANGL